MSQPHFTTKLTMLLVVGFTPVALAANWFVGPNGTPLGKSDGSDWQNAFNGFADVAWSSLACGDTVWVAGGLYSQDLAPAKKCTEANPLTIRRAVASAPEATAVAGWSASFDSTVHQQRATISLDGDVDWVVISGRTGANTNGWWVDFSGATSGTGIELVNGASADHNTFEYLDLQGPGYVTYTGDGRGIDATPFSTATGNIFRHLTVWNWESAIYLVGADQTVFEYLDVSGVAAVNSATFHPNGLYTSGADGLTIRSSRFHSDAAGRGIGEGIFCEQSGGCANWLVYGNVFSGLTSKVIQITSNVSNAKIFNNTFSHCTYTPIEVRADQGGACAGASQTANNLFHASSAPDSCGTASTNLATSADGVFVDLAHGDWHPVDTVAAGYPRNAGTALGTLATHDPDGVAYGNDGQWDIGAFEYAAPSPRPAAPMNLRVVR